MISETDIVQGYRWILGRMPAASEVEATWRLYARHAGDDTHAFQNGLFVSEEFRNRRIHVQQHMRVAPVDLFRSKIVLVHIEKCGGSTLRTMLAAAFEPNRVCPERFNGLADWTANELAAYDLFAGHFDLAGCDVVPGRSTRIVTMLREPRARLLSLYHFWRAHQPDPALGDDTLVALARRSTVMEFFTHGSVVRHPSIRDAMAGQLTRTMGAERIVDGHPVLDDEDPILADPQGCLEAAWDRLRRLSGFGLVERYECSRRLLNHALGLDMQPVEPQQVLRTLQSSRLDETRPPPEPVDAALAARLDALIPIDQALYRRAALLFDERVRNLAR